MVAGLPEKYRRQVNESAYALMKRLGVPQTIVDAAIKHIPDLLEELGNKTPVSQGGKIIRKLSALLLHKISRTIHYCKGACSHIWTRS
jgi:hypothetical protein